MDTAFIVRETIGQIEADRLPESVAGDGQTPARDVEKLVLQLGGVSIRAAAKHSH
jgi:hypothetical protein